MELYSSMLSPLRIVPLGGLGEVGMNCLALELDGTYHDLGLFFDKVSKVPRIINVSGVTIKGKMFIDACYEGDLLAAAVLQQAALEKLAKLPLAGPLGFEVPFQLGNLAYEAAKHAEAAAQYQKALDAAAKIKALYGIPSIFLTAYADKIGRGAIEGVVQALADDAGRLERQERVESRRLELRLTTRPWAQIGRRGAAVVDHVAARGHEGHGVVEVRDRLNALAF